jgi:transposase
MGARASATTIDVDEIVALAGRLDSDELAPADRARAKALLLLFADIIAFVSRKSASIRSLRARLFGAAADRSRSSRGQSRSDETRARRKTGEPDDKPPGHGRIPESAYTGATTIRVEHQTLSVGQLCPDCRRGRLYDMKRPSVSIVLEGGPVVDATRFVRAVLRCSSCTQAFTPSLPEGISDEKFTPSADATIAVMRFMLGMPHYRLEKAQSFVGIPLPRSVQSQRCEVVADAVFPVFLLMLRLAAAAGLIHIDDTKVRILSCIKENKSKAKGERTGTFTTGVVAGPIVGAEGPSITLYFSGRNHSGENLTKLLALRPEDLGPPIRVGDAGSSNLVGKLEVVDAGCWAHARMHFVEIEEQFPDECAHVFEQIRAIYRVDRKAKGKSPDERLELHQQESTPIVDRLTGWMKGRLDQHLTEPNSSLGKAFTYVLGHIGLLTAFLRLPGVPLDNNRAESELRRSGLHRRNSLFYRNEVGAWIGDVIMSIGATCASHSVNPITYLTEVVRNAPQVRANPDQWLPWTYQASRSRASPVREVGVGATARETGPRRAVR